MAKYPENEEGLIIPKDQQKHEYNAGNLEEKLIKKLKAAGLYVEAVG